MKSSPLWTIVYDRFEPDREGLREALCTLGNGYFGTRGSAPEVAASDIHYPATYIAGLYNKLTTNIAGRKIVNEDLVNCPNWTYMTFKIGDAEWFSPSASKILSFRQELDMRNGILTRKLRFQSHRGQITTVETNRIVHMAHPHCGAVRYVITPENYSDWITVGTTLDGTVINTGVPRYRQLNCKHWKPDSLGQFGRNGIFLSMITNQSRITIVEAAKIRIFEEDREIKPQIKIVAKGKEVIGQEFRLFVRKKKPYAIEKNVALYTSKDEGITDPKIAAIEAFTNSTSFRALLKTHQRAWELLWDKFDIQITGDAFSQRIMRLHIFHILQTASVHNKKIDAGLPARGLHGEAYRGHIFWDEIFILPFYEMHMPDIASALLLYRYRRLRKAREYAKKEGKSGAMFPWQSGSTGAEETQVVHLNPMSGKWGPDYSHTQRHVSFAIVYNFWNHWRITGDLEFLINYGAEVILSVAQFGSSLAKYSSKDKRYHIKGVMGPDEFHENFGKTKTGLNDNAYTNVMVVWTLRRAKEVLKILPAAAKSKLLKKLKLTQKEIRRWNDIIRKMCIIINNDGIISQFDGYFDLKELDWVKYREEYTNIQRMDRILKAEGKSPDDYKVSKQADVLMLFYLLPFYEIKEIFEGLGHTIQQDIIEKNYEYYMRRTSHGSSLSKVVHGFLAQRLRKQKVSWWWFQEVLESDIYDTQGGTTPEGIHTGVMGGSIDMVFRGFAGVDIQNERIKIDPFFPVHWKSVKLKFMYRKRWVSLYFTRKKLSVFVRGPQVKGINLPMEINGKLHLIRPGKNIRISLNNYQ